MNKNKLKSFARAARTKLMEQVSNKIDYVLNTDTAELRNKASQIYELKKEIDRTSREEVVEKVAYSWFNRFVALRFMDANGYHTINMKILSPLPGCTEPQILSEAKQGNISPILHIDINKINDLLDGKIPANNPQNEVYQILILAVCHHYYQILPFMFEQTNDYTELLMPDDLISTHSIRHDILENISDEDCQNVEIIGWLYQYYISEKKEQVFTDLSHNKKIKSQDIPAATQLFTPDWIVKYLVENSVGKLWLKNHPDSKTKDLMKYYIDGDNDSGYNKVKSPEEITICDPCCGSGHILVYAFDLLTKIYEEEGYNPPEIPKLILKNNLYGIEIDDRAASLAAFSLVMKARAYYRRFLDKIEKPNVIALQSIELNEDEIRDYQKEIDLNIFTANLIESINQFKDAKTVGSLISPNIASVKDIIPELEKQNVISNIFIYKTHQKVLLGLKQINYLQNKYDCVITNPPYMGRKGMNNDLKDFIEDKYPDSNSDLFSCFIERCLNLTPKSGYTAMITQHSWMFLKSFETFRKQIINKHQIVNMNHLGPKAFEEIGGEVVQSTAFVLNKNCIIDTKNKYIRLVDYKEPSKKIEEFFNDENRYTANQQEFQKISGAPIAYWVSEKVFEIFEKNQKIGEISSVKEGLNTGDNDKFLRFWNEVSFMNIGFEYKNKLDAQESILKWFPCNKGGEYRKWYGNNYWIINWENDGYEIKNCKSSTVRNENQYFKQGITWSGIGSSGFSIRDFPKGFIFNSAGRSIITEQNKKYLTGLLNSNIASIFLSILSPTLSYTVGCVADFPFVFNNKYFRKIKQLSQFSIDISKLVWDSHETSWDFEQNPLIKYSAIKNDFVSNRIETAVHRWEDFESEQFEQLHANEEELNRIFIEIYGLEDEMDPTVSLKDITILQQELDRKQLKEMDADLVRNAETYEVQNYAELELPFDRKELIRQFISYSVGCMLGRYSLDKPGLILANQGETLEDYLEKVPLPSFLPDDDNIIPVLGDEWFTDDIVGRFKEFLKVSFGKEHYEENLRFVEDAIGKDIRKYFISEFYNDHVKRYKKRPIYWMFSSPKKSFNTLIYMHRYKSDTVSRILNEYLREFITKLESRREHLQTISESETINSRDKTKANIEIGNIDKMLKELSGYEQQLHDVASKRIEIDLDDGVKVNYCKFAGVLQKIAGLCE